MAHTIAWSKLLEPSLEGKAKFSNLNQSQNETLGSYLLRYCYYCVIAGLGKIEILRKLDKHMEMKSIRKRAIFVQGCLDFSERDIRVC